MVSLRLRVSACHCFVASAEFTAPWPPLAQEHVLGKGASTFKNMIGNFEDTNPEYHVLGRVEEFGCVKEGSAPTFGCGVLNLRRSFSLITMHLI